MDNNDFIESESASSCLKDKKVTNSENITENMECNDNTVIPSTGIVQSSGETSKD